MFLLALAVFSMPAYPAPNPDEDAIRAVLAAYESTWNAHSPEAWAVFAEHVADDAEWVNIVGMRWRGRDAVIGAHAAFHEVMFRETPLHVVHVDIRPLTPDVSVASVLMDVGAFTPPGSAELPARQNRATLVFVRRDGRWLLASAQNVVIDPVATANDPINQ